MKFNDNFRKTHNQFVGILHAINIYPKIAKMIKTFEVLPAQTKPPREVEVPNEIWLKFMNYLPTKDIFRTFALLNKNLNGLTLDSKALKYLSFGRKLNYSKSNLDQALAVLKHSTGLVGLTINQTDQWKNIVQEVLESDIKSLKSLNIITTGSYSTEFPIELIQALNESKIELDTLILTKFIVKPKTMIEISKMKSLKTLSILDTKQKALNPKVIEAFARNANQLENIEINDKDNFRGPELDKYRVALNNLFESKKSTLKSIKKLNLGSPHCSSVVYSSTCIPFENLMLCQNLEEFCGNLHPHDLKALSRLPNLKKLRFNGFELDSTNVLIDINKSKLKYLCLDGKVEESVLASQYFPALERLCLETRIYMTMENLEKLIKNAPNLKSIQFSNVIYGGRLFFNLPNEFLYKICKDENIFIIFGHILGKNPKNSAEQKSFEDYLIENDVNVFRKYNRMKKDFLKWCENNSRYGY